MQEYIANLYCEKNKNIEEEKNTYYMYRILFFNFNAVLVQFYLNKNFFSVTKCISC